MVLNLDKIRQALLSQVARMEKMKSRNTDIITWPQIPNKVRDKARDNIDEINNMLLYHHTMIGMLENAVKEEREKVDING